jgi:hypothetical protein
MCSTRAISASAAVRCLPTSAIAASMSAIRASPVVVLASTVRSAAMLGYDRADVDWLPPDTVDSFAGTGNPLSVGRLSEDERVLDIGCRAGFETLLAAR